MLFCQSPRQVADPSRTDLAIDWVPAQRVHNLLKLRPNQMSFSNTENQSSAV